MMLTHPCGIGKGAWPKPLIHSTSPVLWLKCVSPGVRQHTTRGISLLKRLLLSDWTCWQVVCKRYTSPRCREHASGEKPARQCMHTTRWCISGSAEWKYTWWIFVIRKV